MEQIAYLVWWEKNEKDIDWEIENEIRLVAVCTTEALARELGAEYLHAMKVKGYRYSAIEIEQIILDTMRLVEKQ